LIIGWELGGLAFVHWTTVRLFDLTSSHAWALAGILGALWLLGSFRILRMGVYVSAYGVRIRGLVGTRTLRWTEIAEFALDQPVYRIPFGAVLVPAGLTVLIRRHSGEYVNTSLWAQGIDFHQRPRVFREVYGLLRERHSHALDLA
jgi:hypothetical protein